MNDSIEIKLRKRHSAQQHIVDTAKRFNVLKCGRRFGKTSLAEELVVEPALDGYPVAYYAPTYKDLNEFWIQIKQILYPVIQSKDETTKQLRLITGGIIDMWSMEDPNSGRGRKYKRVVVDECEKAKKLEEAWKGTIRALLTDFQGDAWFLSTPKFGQTFFKELYGYAFKESHEHEWMSWTYTTYDNPHMSKAEIDAARLTLDDLYFRCEFMAEDVELGAMLWAFAYDKAKHIAHPELNPEHTVFLSFDFNKNPICCSVIQHYEKKIRVIETIKLPNSDIYALCDYILASYGQCMFMVTGDASGKSTSAMVRDNLNYYRIIKLRLGLGDAQIQVPTVNPRLEDNQVLVNSILARYDVEVHEEKAKGLKYDFEHVKMLPDGTIEKGDRKDPAQQADALDTFRYFCNTFMGWFIKRSN